jgi:DNA-binding transcriptional LysR family regulator
MATASSQIEARVFGRDQRVSGPLRFTLPISLATDLLMPTLAGFMHAYPDIALEIIASGTIANLGNREADVALRVVTGDTTPPGNLYGMKLCDFYTGYYGHLTLFAAPSGPIPWLLGPGEAVPSEWQPEGGIRMTTTPIRFAEMRSQFEAARAAMGITLLPCFLGDADPVLARVPGGPVARIGDVWLLTHGETRQTKRVRLLCEHIRTAMQDYSERMAGRPDII